MLSQRVRKLKEARKKKGPILYWISRDQRVKDNWALIFAQTLAIKEKEPLFVLFCLIDSFLGSDNRNFIFMLNGLEELKDDLMQLNINFVLKEGDPSTIIPNFIKSYNISTLITDFSPLKIKTSWMEEIVKKINISFYEVDAHNIIPCWIASDKREYAAYTFRPKINRLLNVYLDEFPKMKIHPYQLNDNLKLDFKKIRSNYRINIDIPQILWLKAGERSAIENMNNFKKEKLIKYTQDKNEPYLNATSNISPYLHFGQISSQRVVLELSKQITITSLKNSFYDEIIVRKELSDNFCYYTPNYSKFESFPLWARQTLNVHRSDPRDYVYTLKEFQNAQTHDEIWNAAQNQMILTGKMHGYMRMYWGKKILEWTASPEDALKIATHLNDTYELDGRDPNGYVGIAWSVGGVHDRAWKERRIFGKIRYMSANGLKRKFNIENYVEEYSQQN